MSKTLKEIFDTKSQQVENDYAKWYEIYHEKMQPLLGDSEETRSIVKTDRALLAAIEKFTNEIKNPRIILATSGTTSGGKSSLVNLLCGAEIMPVAVQEMSAGTVVIDHHPTKRHLKIPHVEGLPAENCGEWADLTNDDIRQRLQAVMEQYRQLREENREPPAPRIEVQYPTRLGRRPDLAGLPKGFKLRIIDLPGLKYVADDHNRQVIRDEIKPALCLVTYNSEETDPNKQQELLNEVVTQVREMRGTPARMLFVLNRIDVFRRDGNWQEQSKKFIEKVTKDIRGSVAKALPEYKEQAQELRSQPLSTYPALRANQVLENPSAELSIQALEKIDKNFSALMPEEIVDELPRKISKWSESERKQVAEAVWRESYGYEFDETLRRHIHDNLPQLLLPHLVKSVTDAAGEAFTNAHQIAHARINATEERYQAECERLDRIGVDLQQLREESKQELCEIVNFSEEENNDFYALLTDMADQLQKNYELPDGSLVPLYDWMRELGNAVEKFFSSIYDAILEEKKPQGQLIDSLPPQEREALDQVLMHLQESGYGRYADNGGHFNETASQDEKNQLRKMNESLNELAEVLVSSLKMLLERIVELEAERILDALQIFTEKYAHFLSEKAQTIASDLAVAMTASKLVRVKQRLLLNFKFTAGFPIHQKQRDVKIGEKQVKLGEERRWYTLWLLKKSVYEKQDVYEKRDYESAVIPSLMDIMTIFITQAKASRPEAEFVRWLRDQLDEFLKGIDKDQEDMLKKYRHRLDQAMQEATQENEQNLAQWQPIVDELASLNEKLPELSKVDY
ncbi:MAG: dynamin family protein [Pseudomonadota bacterium]